MNYILSEDGKKLIEYKGKDDNIIIPSGVETIDEIALSRAKIKTLWLPKELKELGKHTLIDTKKKAKNIQRIIVEEGNPYFASDEKAFYSIKDNKKTLIRYFDRNITEYIASDDIIHYEKDAFFGCVDLEKIQLSKNTESFTEYALPEKTKVNEIILPKSVQHLQVRVLFSLYERPKAVNFIIDEESEYLFKDEDSIYEVLEDNTYKLIRNYYEGKGKVLILENTTILGEKSFFTNKNVNKIEIPSTISKIEDEAFSCTGLTEITLSENIHHVGKKAFAYNKLTNAKLSSKIEYVAKNAFLSTFLKNVETIEGEDAYTFEDEIIYQKNKNNIDEFMKFALRLKDSILELKMNNKDHANIEINIDEIKKEIHVKTILIQQHYDTKLVDERVKTAELVSIGTKLDFKVEKRRLDVIYKKKNLGEVHSYIANIIIPYMKQIKIKSCIVNEITPKSKKRANAKYASGSIKFVIGE